MISWPVRGWTHTQQTVGQPFLPLCGTLPRSQHFSNFSSLSSPAIGQRKFGGHSRGLYVDVTDLQGSCVLFSTCLSVLPATWNSPMGFMHQSGISEFYSGCFGLERNPIRINAIQQRGVYCTDTTGISRDPTRTQNGPKHKEQRLFFLYYRGCLLI